MLNYFLGSFAVVISLFVGATSVNADTTNFDGVYKPVGEEFSHWDCKTVGQDGGAISIKNNVFRGIENRCRLNNPTNVNGMSAILFDAECAGEGSEWTQRIMLMQSDFGVYYITDQFVATWQKCPSQF